VTQRGLPWALALAITLAALVALAEPGSGSMSPHPESITQGLDCSACHTTSGWDLLGGAPSGQSGFDHSRTGFPLTGRHRNAACTDCHNGKRKVTRDCAGCHRDSHRQRLGQACDSCHSAQSWHSVRAIERHRRTRLPLTGMHALADCTECHRRAGDNQWTGVPANCFACHANDYRRPDVHPRHTGTPGDPTAQPFSRDCTECHRATGWIPAVISTKTFAVTQGLMSRRAHDARFPISFGKHRTATCGNCHTSLARPRIVRCDGCHAHSPVRLKQQHRRIAGPARSCLGCHPGGARR
jgi:hypothetical protein